MYTELAFFEWDPNKGAANVRKHGVQFPEAAGVFSDDYAVTINDDGSDPEQRFVTLGMGIKRQRDHLSSDERATRTRTV